MAMAQALDMGEAERAERLGRFSGRVRQWTAKAWLTAQLDEIGFQARRQ
jgi:trehalose-6-phosphate synthase